MGKVVSSREYGQILTASMRNRQKAIQDLVFNSNPVSKILRESGMFKTFSGPEITIPLTVDKLDSQWFTGYDPLHNSPKEILNSAVFTPKNMAVGFSLSGTQTRANEGPERVIDIVSAYMKNAQESMRDDWEEALHADGTGSNGREMVGFGGALPLIPTVGTYGGIDRNLHPIWQPSVFDAATDFGVAGWDSTTARGILGNIVARRSKGARYAKIAIADLNAYQALEAGMVAYQRVIINTPSDGRQSVGAEGPKPLEVPTPTGTVRVYCATGVGTVMPANTIYGIDPEGLEIRYMSNYNMVPLFEGDGARPINQDAHAQYLLWVGEVILNNPRFSWRLKATPS